MTRESTAMGTANWYLQQLGDILRTLRKDILPIALVGLCLAVIGAVSGKMTNSVSSSAQLLLTPVPLRDATTEDELSRMIAMPMDIRTASLLCMSDEAISRTRDMLEQEDVLESPVENLQSLKNALSFEITVAKDTPYDTIYSPVLRLTAKGNSPTVAKALVNTWAKACVELSEQYLDRKQVPVQRAFEERSEQIRTSLDAADEALELFRRENNLTYMQERVIALTKLINDTLALRAESSQKMENAQAKRSALVAELTSEDPKLKLNWTPSGRLTALVGGQFGGENGGDGAPGMLEVEQSNPVYEAVRQESALAQALAAGYEAEIDRIDEQLVLFEVERKTLQAELARIERLDRELLRETEVLELVYQNAASKQEYARMAAGLQTSEIQILSEGAEWRMPRFRRAILYGVIAGIWGLLLAGLTSILIRQVFRPALEQTK